MAGATPTPSVDDVVYALRTKAADLFHFSGMLLSAGNSDPEAILAKQEATNCSNRAHALLAGSPCKFPTQATLDDLSKKCDVLENAISTSADWATLVAAASAVRKAMPASTV
jgi:hypothetical protein